MTPWSIVKVQFCPADGQSKRQKRQKPNFGKSVQTKTPEVNLIEDLIVFVGSQPP